MTGRSRLPFLVVARSQVCSSYGRWLRIIAKASR